MIPTDIKLHSKSRLLEIGYANGTRYQLPCEYLRVYSPSAEVRGHGPGQEVLQLGKEHVNIKNIEQVGNYALKLIFDDGHSTGLYTWDFLQELGENQAEYWQNYLDALQARGIQRAEH